MTEQQQHLKAALEQQASVLDEIQKLNNSLNVKRDLATKLQGVIEYLTGIGVSLPTEDGSPETPNEEVSEAQVEVQE